ncbi:MAG: hypothetical protein LBM07_00870 [Culturomica sp.]|nr:hypothetical protein [Culturomica sp.]
MRSFKGTRIGECRSNADLLICTKGNSHNLVSGYLNPLFYLSKIQQRFYRYNNITEPQLPINCGVKLQSTQIILQERAETF